MSDEFNLNMGDDEFTVDFSEALEFKILDTGWYPVRIVNAEKRVTTTEDGGTLAMIALRMDVTAGEYEGQPLFVNWPLGGRGAGITKQGLKAALGSTPESGQAFSVSDLADVEMEVFVRPNVWKVEDGGDGEARNRVQRYRSLTSDSLNF